MRKFNHLILLSFLVLALAGCDSNKAIKLEQDNQKSQTAIIESTSTPNIASDLMRSVGDLHIPAKYSDLCGFMSKNKCPEFSFINGELPGKYKDKKDANGAPKYPEIYLITSGAKFGKILINNKNIDIVVVPYNWIWGSGGFGVYIAEKINNSFEVTARIDTGKSQANILEIADNKIKFSARDWGEAENHNKTCFFKDDKLSEEFLQCAWDK